MLDITVQLRRYLPGARWRLFAARRGVTDMYAEVWTFGVHEIDCSFGLKPSVRVNHCRSGYCRHNIDRKYL